MGAEKALDQSDRGRAVDIVVAEGGNLLPCPDRGGEARGSALHVLEARRVRQESAKRWIEIAGEQCAVSAPRAASTRPNSSGSAWAWAIAVAM